MANYELQTFTSEAGEQAIIAVDPAHAVTIAVVSGGTTDEIDLEIHLEDPDKTTPTRIKDSLDIVAGVNVFTKSITGPISGIGIDININNSSDIKVYVVTTRRES